jgi:hypothetical protein
MVMKCWICSVQRPQKKIWQQRVNSFALPQGGGITFGHVKESTSGALNRDRREEASQMRQIFTENTPVSAFAAAGVCSVSPDSRARVQSPAVASLLAAWLPQAHQAQIMPMILVPAAGSYKVTETKPSVKLGGFRGVPPRGRPV